MPCLSIFDFCQKACVLGLKVTGFIWCELDISLSSMLGANCRLHMLLVKKDKKKKKTRTIL